jgi:hypothetical protein
LYVAAGCAGTDETVEIDREERLRRELAPALRRDSVGLSVVTAADGSQMMATEGRFGAAMVVRRNADGTTTKKCVDTIEDAMRVLAPAARVNGGKERE